MPCCTGFRTCAAMEKCQSLCTHARSLPPGNFLRKSTRQRLFLSHLENYFSSELQSPLCFTIRHDVPGKRVASIAVELKTPEEGNAFGGRERYRRVIHVLNGYSQPHVVEEIK